LTIFQAPLAVRSMRLRPDVVLTQNVPGEVSMIAPIASAARPSRVSIVSKRAGPAAPPMRCTRPPPCVPTHRSPCESSASTDAASLLGDEGSFGFERKCSNLPLARSSRSRPSVR
jgi:hypothetical protein